MTAFGIRGRRGRRATHLALLAVSAASLACSPDTREASDAAAENVLGDSTALPELALQWPIERGISSFVTQSPADSGQSYPCGSGVNGRHILRDKHGDNEDYLQSIDIVVRARNAPEVANEGRGIDVLAVADGIVVAQNMQQNECDRPFGAGNYVIVEHPQVVIEGKALRSAYMHLNSTAQSETQSDCGINPSPTLASSFSPPPLGSRVKAGQKLGELGNTGNSTGPHLHFQFATDCTLEPASAVDCPSVAILDVSPQGFSDIRIARDASCELAPAIGGPSARPDASSYLADGSYVTPLPSNAGPRPTVSAVGGP